MRLPFVRMMLAMVCATMAGSCSPPLGIHRGALLKREIDLSCVVRGMKGVAGLGEVYTDVHPGESNMNSTTPRTNWASAVYTANGLTDVLDAGSVILDVSHAGKPIELVVSHSFDRRSDRGVSRQQLQTAVDIMKRVERAVGAACGIDLVAAMRMSCGPSLNECEGIV